MGGFGSGKECLPPPLGSLRESMVPASGGLCLMGRCQGEVSLGGWHWAMALVGRPSDCQPASSPAERQRATLSPPSFRPQYNNTLPTSQGGFWGKSISVRGSVRCRHVGHCPQGLPTHCCLHPPSLWQASDVVGGGFSQAVVRT